MPLPAKHPANCRGSCTIVAFQACRAGRAAKSAATHFRGGAVCVIVGPLLFSGSCSTLLNIMRISRDSQLGPAGNVSHHGAVVTCE